MKLLYLIALLTSMPFHTDAYLDPGTGSFVAQIIIATFATVLFSIKLFWRKIINSISHFFSRKHEE
jgi:energy-coupling factor transporter transmembrane protein EcfT